jgi:tubulin polyglutamylase TTLL6/13
MCFEILGFDIFLDNKLKPWLIEVNHTPSFATDSPLDFKIKKGVIMDTFKLLSMSFYKKQKFKREKQMEFQTRAIKGKVKQTREMKDAIKKKKNDKRHKAESRIQTDYELIFPSENFNYDKWQNYFDAAFETFNEFNFGAPKQKTDKEPAKPEPKSKTEATKTRAETQKPFRPSNARVMIKDEAGAP